MTAIQHPFPSHPGPSLQKTGEQRLLRVEVDDQNHLIFKRAFCKNGQFYDIRILRRAVNGDVIKVDDKTPFSKWSLGKIQTLAASIFNDYNKPDQIQITYQGLPNERCMFRRGSAITDLVKVTNNQQDYQKAVEIVLKVRAIHGFFAPAFRMEVSTNPNRPLLIYPTHAPKPAPIPPPNPPQLPILSPPTHPITDRPSLGGTSSATAASGISSSPPGTEKIDTDLRKELDRVRPKGDLLQGVTYLGLRKYASNPESEEVGDLASSNNHTALTAFQDLVEYHGKSDSARQTEKVQQMQEWIIALYEQAYLYYIQNTRKHFDQQQEQQQQLLNTEAFDLWCRHSAANAVVGFITQINSSIEPLVKFLEKRVPPRFMHATTHS